MTGHDDLIYAGALFFVAWIVWDGLKLIWRLER